MVHNWSMATHNHKTESERLRLPIIKPAHRELGCGYVYLIICGEFTKIGLATDPEKRLAQMQAGNPHPMTIAKVWHTLTPALDGECLHAQYEAQRIRGDWFSLTPSQLAHLLSLDDLSCYRE